MIPVSVGTGSGDRLPGGTLHKWPVLVKPSGVSEGHDRASPDGENQRAAEVDRREAGDGIGSLREQTGQGNGPADRGWRPGDEADEEGNCCENYHLTAFLQEEKGVDCALFNE